MKLSKKILAVALSVLMIISVMPFAAFAASSGTFNTGLSWNIDDNGNLTFSGSGAIPEAAFRFNYNYTEVVIDSCVTAIGEEAFRSSSVKKVMVSANFASAPYAFVTDALTSVTFEEGVTTIPSYMFVHCYYDPGFELNLPSTLTNIASNAFYNCKITSVTIPEGAALQEDSFVLEEKSAIYNMVIEGNTRTFAVGQFGKLENDSNVQIYEGCKVVGTIPGEATVNVAESCPQAQVAESYKELFIEKVNEWLSYGTDIEYAAERAFDDIMVQSMDDADAAGDPDKEIQGDAYADYYTVSVGEAEAVDAEITA